MPVVVGRRPSSKLVREGLHSGDWQCALRKVVPRAASLSMYGVFAIGCPPRWPIQSFWSSMAMKRMLGRSAERVGATSKQEMRSARIFFMVLGDRDWENTAEFYFLGDIDRRNRAILRRILRMIRIFYHVGFLNHRSNFHRRLCSSGNPKTIGK